MAHIAIPIPTIPGKQDIEIEVTVNGQKVDTYENTMLRDKDKIVIIYQSK